MLVYVEVKKQHFDIINLFKDWCGYFIAQKNPHAVSMGILISY